MAEYACDQGYKTRVPARLGGDPVHEGHAALLRGRVRAVAAARSSARTVYKIGQTEFRTQVTKIQNADPAPDVIFSPMFVPDSGAFLKALRGAGVETPVPVDRRQRLDAVRRLGRQRRRRGGLLDPRLRGRGQRAAGVPRRTSRPDGRRRRSRTRSRRSGATTSTRSSQAVEDAGSMEPDALLERDPQA